MGFNDAITINDVVLYVEESDRETIQILLAVNDVNIYIPGSSMFEIENDSNKRRVIGKEWMIKTQILDIVKWIFIQSFSNPETANNFKFFSKILHMFQVKQVTKLNFGMLGEILFAYQMKCGVNDIQKWLSAKNKNFDFNISNNFYEIKTKTLIEKEVVLNLSYNQVTSIGDSNLNLVLVVINTGPYFITRLSLIEYFQSLKLRNDELDRIIECIEIFDCFEHFKFSLLKYIGRAIKIELDDRIISINCKIKFDVEYDFENLLIR